jgi:hypothetical protein
MVAVYAGSVNVVMATPAEPEEVGSHVISPL